MEVELHRDEIEETGIFGTLLLDGKYEFDTLELLWKENQRDISCIPRGTYSCTPVYTSKFGRVILVKDVPHRSSILIHAGNTVNDTKGCILIGRYKHYTRLQQSRIALGLFLLSVPDSFKLTISGIQ